MLKKLSNIVMMILGAVIGYGLFQLVGVLLEKGGHPYSNFMTPGEEVVISIAIALISGLIFFRMTPLIRRNSIKVADGIEKDLREVSTNDLITGVVGMIIGLIIAFLITQIYVTITNKYLYLAITIISYIVFAYVGIVIGTKRGKDIFNVLVNRNGAVQPPVQTAGVVTAEGGLFAKKKRFDGVPKIFDTSVIIDGRILEIMKTGFIEGPIIIPEFVLVELRHIADSSDSLKRVRGRRGLDILNKIQEEYGIEIYNTDNEKSLKEIPEVDVKLLKLAQLMNGKVVTNDFNLNKVATINGVKVLNINELANTLKPVVLPGEEMTVHLVKQGKDNSQAIGYLDDGTMIVVEDGRKMIGQTIAINVTSVLQTSAGRMIFGRVKKG